MKKGWEEIKMVDACEILTCGVASTPTYVDKQIGVPFLSAQNVRDGEVVLEKYSFISKEFHQKLTSKNKPSKGDILYSRVGAKYGEAGVVEHSFEFSVYVSVTLIRPKRELLNNYFLKYYLNSPRIKDLAKKSISSSGVPNLNVNSVRDFLVPIPPLPEQQRIVAILDEAFTTIAKAKDNAEQNLKNAKELFESYLQGVFENPKDNWEVCNLETYIKLIDYRGRTPVKTESGVRLITAKNVKLGYLQLEPQEFIANNNYESWMSRGIPNFGDVIFTTEAPLANVAQIDTLDKVAFAQRIIVMQPNPLKLNQTFLKYMLLSNPIRNKILDKGTGATVLGIKSSLLKKVEIYFPSSINEQQKIVEKLDVLSIETKKLEAIYQQKINDLEELKKSVLQKAFSGELKTDKLCV